MAFNPFEMMRKRGKTILSVVTICIMFIFVLSSGLAGGDFFNDFLPRLFGSSRGVGGVYGEGFGRKITAEEVRQTQQFRRAASEFMLRADEAADTARIREIDRRMEKFPAATRDVIKNFVDARMKAFSPSAKDTDRQAADQKYKMTLMIERFTLQQGRSKFQERMMQVDPAKDKEEAEALQTVLGIITKQQRQSFFGWPNQSEKDAIDFILLKRKADKEGIQYPQEDLNALVAEDLRMTLSVADSAAIEKDMRRDNRYQNMRSRDLVQALTDEYRVNTVLAANYPLEQPAGTPREFFDNYRDMTDEIQYAVVAAPVRSFMDKVPEEPKPEELKKLYDKYRTYEPNPRSENPGFKEPRRLKLEYLAVDATAKMYAEGGPLIDAVTAVAAGMVPGGGPAQAIIGATTPLLVQNETVRGEVEQTRKYEREFQGWNQWMFDSPHDANALNPLPIASLAGLLHTPLNPMADFVAGVTYKQLVQALETRDRVKVGMAWELAGLAPPPQPYLAALTTMAALMPKELPDAAYEGPIRKRLAEQRVGALFDKDMKGFFDKINLYNLYITPKADPAKFKENREAAVKYIIEFAATRGLKLGSAGEARDRYGLRNDPGLKALADKMPRRAGSPDELAQMFFDRVDQRQGGMVPLGENDAVLFQPHWVPRQPGPDEIRQPNYIAWVSEDLPSKSYLNFDLAPPAIKERVKDAWKYAKAREIARKTAGDFATKAKELATAKLPNPSGAIVFEDALGELARASGMVYKGRVSMSPLKLDKMPVSIQDRRNPGYVENFAVPADIVEYPGRMAFAMIENRSKPVGETLVLPDEPTSGFYVAVLDDKREKSVSDFSSVYTRSFAAGSGGRDPFYAQRFEPFIRREGFRDALERLYAEAKYKPDAAQEESLKKNADPNDIE